MLSIMNVFSGIVPLAFLFKIVAATGGRGEECDFDDDERSKGKFCVDELGPYGYYLFTIVFTACFIIMFFVIIISLFQKKRLSAQRKQTRKYSPRKVSRGVGLRYPILVYMLLVCVLRIVWLIMVLNGRDESDLLFGNQFVERMITRIIQVLYLLGFLNIVKIWHDKYSTFQDSLSTLIKKQNRSAWQKDLDGYVFVIKFATITIVPLGLDILQELFDDSLFRTTANTIITVTMFLFIISGLRVYYLMNKVIVNYLNSEKTMSGAQEISLKTEIYSARVAIVKISIGGIIIICAATYKISRLMNSAWSVLLYYIIELGSQVFVMHVMWVEGANLKHKISKASRSAQHSLQEVTPRTISPTSAVTTTTIDTTGESKAIEAPKHFAAEDLVDRLAAEEPVTIDVHALAMKAKITRTSFGSESSDGSHTYTNPLNI